MKSIILSLVIATCLWNGSDNVALNPEEKHHSKEHIQLNQQELIQYNGGEMDICAFYGFGMGLGFGVAATGAGTAFGIYIVAKFAVGAAIAGCWTN